jgi:hypothetical protein
MHIVCHIQSTNSIAKRFALVDGKITKTAAAQVTHGHASLQVVESLEAFGTWLDTLGSNSAVTYGTPEHDSPLTTAALVNGHDIARTRQYFAFRQQPGMMMLDVDGCSDSPDAVHAKLISAAPWIAGAKMLWRASSSSGINGCGLRGQRFYFLVEDASQIPRIGEKLNADLWIAGHGRIEIGNAGQLLTRTLVDSSVWQPERLDFVAPPILGAGVTRERYPSRIFPGGDLDLAKVMHPETETAKRLIKAAKQAIKPKAEPIQRQHAERIAKRLGIATAAVMALHRGVMPSDFVLHRQGGGTVTVGELLKAPIDGQRFADPLEPDYGSDDRIAVLRIAPNGGINIYSHAHGGQIWVLSRSRGSAHELSPDIDLEERDGRVAIVIEAHTEGASVRACEAAITDSHYWARGGLVAVSDGEMQPMSQSAVRRACNDAVAAYKPKDKDYKPASIPENYIAQIHAAGAATTTLRLLDGVSDLPIWHDGVPVSAEGYHALSRYYLTPFDLTPMTPHEGARALLSLLDEFRFADDRDRVSALAAIMTGVFRPAWAAAPAYLITAPRPQSGKTYLAEVIGAIATGRIPAAEAMPYERDELNKHLLAKALSGRRVALFDNLTRDVPNSDALNSIITSGSISGRILGATEIVEAQARMLILATGNNVAAREDTARRFIPIRLDPMTEDASAIEYKGDARTDALRDRVTLVSACFAVASFKDERPGLKHATDFCEWQALVRKPLWHLLGVDCLDGMLEQRATSEAPAHLAEMLDGILEAHGRAQFSAQDLVRMSGSADLHEALMAICGDRSGALSALKAGHWLARHVDYIHGGKVIRAEGKNKNRRMFRVT